VEGVKPVRLGFLAALITRSGHMPCPLSAHSGHMLGTPAPLGRLVQMDLLRRVRSVTVTAEP
jgi:hypothetical protein